MAVDMDSIRECLVLSVSGRGCCYCFCWSSSSLQNCELDNLCNGCSEDPWPVSLARLVIGDVNGEVD